MTSSWEWVHNDTKQTVEVWWQYHGGKQEAYGKRPIAPIREALHGTNPRSQLLKPDKETKFQQFVINKVHHVCVRYNQTKYNPPKPSPQPSQASNSSGTSSQKLQQEKESVTICANKWAPALGGDRKMLKVTELLKEGRKIPKTMSLTIDDEDEDDKHWKRFKYSSTGQYPMPYDPRLSSVMQHEIGEGHSLPCLCALTSVMFGLIAYKFFCKNQGSLQRLQAVLMHA
eukprot:gnl/MRDRNA2_/MRDRNA2_57079_c0_seq1.p1 gnl/MRDRNA2_/MRDRNA2_57079_c0~~gnl/MRDRNA2_/MRDRNA2_57079_c0_seq1.p1  ORF type:complete len:228 (+),score=27.19 gnl/MRDRNA2_/MRDRNA2_57079_c0_seq1:127-810(+)